MVFVDARGIDWYYVRAILVVFLTAGLHAAVVLRGDRDRPTDPRRPVPRVLLTMIVIGVLFHVSFGNGPFVEFQF